MSFFWRRRLSDIFDEIEELMREIERMTLTALEDYEPIMARRGIQVRGPIVYGVRITIGPDGRPVVEEFGNVKRIGRKPVIEETIEPLVDVIDEKDRVTIVAEMPGLDKDDIDIRIKDGRLVITGKGKDRKYYKEIRLPPGIKPETAKAKYKNGVLEVTIEKENEEKKKEENGIKVKIE